MGYSPWGHKRVRQDLATKHKQTLLPPWTPQNYNHLESTWVFPGGSDGKEFACSGGDLGWIPGLGRSPGERKGYLLQYSGLENSMDRIVHGVAKSRTQLSDFRFP